MIYQSNLQGASTALSWGVQTVLTVSTTTLHVDVSDTNMIYLHTTLPIYISFTAAEADIVTANDLILEVPRLLTPSDDAVVYVPTTYTLVVPNAVDPGEAKTLNPTAPVVKMNLLRGIATNATVRVILA
jgi:hypothetical protein|tara:strand:+ start:51 stop:437 length:387 start_codon:yes stop_codon:yes gene_type:complete